MKAHPQCEDEQRGQHADQASAIDHHRAQAVAHGGEGQDANEGLDGFGKIAGRKEHARGDEHGIVMRFMRPLTFPCSRRGLQPRWPWTQSTRCRRKDTATNARYDPVTCTEKARREKTRITINSRE